MRKPRSLMAFQKAFPDEAACAAFLARRRWPKGFICPECGGGQAHELKSRAWVWVCAGCRRQTSVTAGTVLHRTKLPLTVWFWAAHLMATHSNGISALQLSSQLSIGYKTAWLLAQKLRRSMPDPERELLEGVVEIDQTELPYRDGQKSDGPNAGKIIVIGAVEVRDRKTGKAQKPKRIGAKYLDTMSGRCRLQAIPSNEAKHIHAFIRRTVKAGSTLLTDGHRSYNGLTDYRHDPRVVGKMAAHIPLQWIHRVFSLLKRWGLGTYHGLRRKHIDTYLEEFAFRYNRRYYRHVSFETILGLSARHAPAGYWQIIGRENPRKDDVPVRLGPRRRKTAMGMRPDGASTVSPPPGAG